MLYRSYSAMVERAESARRAAAQHEAAYWEARAARMTDRARYHAQMSASLVEESSRVLKSSSSRVGRGGMRGLLLDAAGR